MAAKKPTNTIAATRTGDAAIVAAIRASKPVGNVSVNVSKAIEPESRIVQPGGVHADDLEVLDKGIDARMTALLKDHQRMGARPK